MEGLQRLTDDVVHTDRHVTKERIDVAEFPIKQNREWAWLGDRFEILSGGHIVQIQVDLRHQPFDVVFGALTMLRGASLLRLFPRDFLFQSAEK